MRITLETFDDAVRRAVAEHWSNPNRRASVTRERDTFYIEHPDSTSSQLMVSIYPTLPAELPRVFAQYGGELHKPDTAIWEVATETFDALTDALADFDYDVNELLAELAAEEAEA